MDLSNTFDTINHELLILNYMPVDFPKMPSSSFSVICQTVAKGQDE